MEASARGDKDAGGTTIGVIARFFRTEANPFIDRKIRVKTPNERLQRLIGLGDAYVVLKGGTGTLAELATVWEYANKGMMKGKPIILIGDFWSEIFSLMLQQLREEGITGAGEAITAVSSPRECIGVLREQFRKRNFSRQK